MFPFLWPKLLWDHGCYMPELFRSNWSQNISLPYIQARMLGGIFAPTRRATNHEVILNVVIFIKHLLFSFLIPQWGIYIKGKCIQRESLWFFRTLWRTPICGKVDISRTGMVWGGHGPQSIPWCYTDLCLPAEKVGADRNHEGRGSNTPWVISLCTWPPSPSITLAAPSPPLQGVPRGGNKQQHGAQLK